MFVADYAVLLAILRAGNQWTFGIDYVINNHVFMMRRVLASLDFVIVQRLFVMRRLLGLGFGMGITHKPSKCHRHSKCHFCRKNTPLTCHSTH